VVRKLTVIAILAAALLGTSATGASATTWDGSCDMSGHTDFARPYHFTIDNNDYQTFLSGTCEGTLDGKPFSGPADLFIDGRMNKPMSCETGLSNDIPGLMHFGAGSPEDVDATLLDIRTKFEFHFGTVLPFVFEGAYNGMGLGVIQFQDPQQKFQECSGPGMSTVDVEMTSRTLGTAYG
jgi:hypothetical protein